MRRYLLLVVIAAALVAAGVLYYVNHRVTGPLTGEQVSRDIANRRPIAVTIDNFSPNARPQAGLDKASVVFETLAEGGITRFLAVYLERDAGTVGPVRSTRMYFNAWAAGLHAIFGHDGGNVDALQELPSLSTIYNEDADRITGPFYRVSSRIAPYNEYTSTAALRSYAEQHGGSATRTGMSFPHKSDALPFQRPSHFVLSIQFSYGEYNVSWDYDAAANDYLRFMGGSPHVDAITGKQLRARNVIVLMTDESPSYDPFTPGAIHMRTEGTGTASVYRDGTVVHGTWSKPSVEAPLQVLDASGKEIPLNTGNTWIEVVPKGNAVTTTP